MRSRAALLLLAALAALAARALASDGDRSPYYLNCRRDCARRACRPDGVSFTPTSLAKQTLMNRLTLWNCRDECRYYCMWKTVAGFEERQWGVPKFHGKWPFVRVLGMQELGSVIGSVLNLAAHLYMYRELRARFSSRNTPLLYIWHVFALVCIHGWVWSVLFHARDTAFTEFMDYACAMSMVMVLYLTCIIRLTYAKFRMMGYLVSAASLVYYTDHVRYLYRGKIDYEYNLLANIVPGAIAAVLWSAWAVWRCRRVAYPWRVLAFSLLAALFMALELLDFPPYLYVWDAHALWHMSTAFLPLIFYRFVFDDLSHLRRSWPDNVLKTDTKLC